MKIILSPSKTQAIPVSSRRETELPILDLEATLSLFHRLKRMSKKRLALTMDLEGKLLEKTYRLYQDFDPKTSLTLPAIELYTGLVFDQLDLKSYDADQRDYLNNHLRILSAMYGLVHPQNQIWPYRLDFTMTLPKPSLKTIWSKRIRSALETEDWIIDLSSQEFGSLLSGLSSKIHQVIFLERIAGQERIISANAKKARGKMAHYLIRNRITDLDGLRRFHEDGYVVQPLRSDPGSSLFLKVSD